MRTFLGVFFWARNINSFLICLQLIYSSLRLVNLQIIKAMLFSLIICEELTHWKRPWCWEGLRAEGEGDDRGWDGGMASPIQWTWVWVDSRSCWWTGRTGVLLFMGSQRVGCDWVTELNWMPMSLFIVLCLIISHNQLPYPNNFLCL